MSQYAFWGLSSLATLNMSRSPITYISNDTFTDLLRLQYIDLSYSTLIEIHLAQFHHGCSIIITDTKNLTWIYVGNSVSNISVITDSSMVCCHLGSRLNCSGPDSKIDWCGSGLNSQIRTAGGTLSCILLVLSIICLIIRSMSNLNDKYMKLCLILVSSQDTLIAAYGMLITIKDVVYPIEYIYHTSGFKYKLCVSAGIIQMIAVAAISGLVSCIAFAYYYGLKGLSYKKTQTMKRYGMMISHGFTVIIVVILLFMFTPYKMTDLCSLIWTGLPPSANHYVVGALLLSNHVVNSAFTCYLFWKADRMVKMSKAAVRNASGSVFGSYQQRPVVRFSALTCLFPVLTGLLILSVFVTRRSTESFLKDLIISIYVIPCIAITKSLICLSRFACRKTKESILNTHSCGIAHICYIFI